MTKMQKSTWLERVSSTRTTTKKNACVTTPVETPIYRSEYHIDIIIVYAFFVFF